MIKNNYNTNANGPDIEVSIFYDTDLSYILFYENIETLQCSSYYKNAVAYYHGGEGVPELEWTVNGTTKALRDYIKAEVVQYSDKPLSRMTKVELLDDIHEHLNREFTVDLVHESDIAEHLEQYGLQWVCNREIFKHEVRGYSQGDYATVYTHHENVSREYLTNLLYGTPISARMEVNGEEYYSKYDGLYEWNRDEAIEDFAKQTGLDKEEFAYMIPEQPDYE